MTLIEWLCPDRVHQWVTIIISMSWTEGKHEHYHSWWTQEASCHVNLDYIRACCKRIWLQCISKEVRCTISQIFTVRAAIVMNLDNLEFCLHNCIMCSVVVELLEQRYSHDILYTWAGSTLVAINPYKDIPDLYSQRTQRLFSEDQSSEKRVTVPYYLLFGFHTWVRLLDWWVLYTNG